MRCCAPIFPTKRAPSTRVSPSTIPGTSARKPPAPSGKPEGKVKAKDAKMKVRDEAAAGGDFIDLSSMLMDDEVDGTPAKDTRMTVADEEPTGDERSEEHTSEFQS